MGQADSRDEVDGVCEDNAGIGAGTAVAWTSASTIDFSSSDFGSFIAPERPPEERLIRESPDILILPDLSFGTRVSDAACLVVGSGL